MTGDPLRQPPLRAYQHLPGPDKEGAERDGDGLARDPLTRGFVVTRRANGMFLSTLLMGVHHFCRFVWEGVVGGLAGR